MTIQWTDAAIEAADRAYQRNIEIVDSFEFWRTVLDAAVKAQKQSGVRDVTDYMSGMADGYEKARADALEEAAKVAESGMLSCDIGGELILDPFTASTIAAAIRALKEKVGT